MALKGDTMSLWIELAQRAVAESWGESYSSPEDMMSPLPEGTLDLCGVGSDTYTPWYRVWCADGSARSLYA